MNIESVNAITAITDSMTNLTYLCLHATIPQSLLFILSHFISTEKVENISCVF